MTETERLVAENLDLVRAIAGKLKLTLGKTADFDDLVGYGNQGLMEAAQRFDPNQGVTFVTFAYYRIRGGMLDGMRTMGWYSRTEYARFRAEERANEYLQSENDRTAAIIAAGADPTPARVTEAAKDATQTLASIAETLGGIATIHFTSIEAASQVADDRFANAETSLTNLESQHRIRAAVAKLPERERRLMELYYFEDKSLEDVGTELGLSRSWACRLHARAVGLLRRTLAKSE